MKALYHADRMAFSGSVHDVLRCLESLARNEGGETLLREALAMRTRHGQFRHVSIREGRELGRRSSFGDPSIR